MNKWFDRAMDKAFDHVFSQMQHARQDLVPSLLLQEVGTVQSVSTGIALVSGLSNVGFEELLKFPMGIYGIAFNLDKEMIGVVLLGDHSQLNAGDEVTRTHRVMDIVVGDELLGRVIDPLGQVLDDKPALTQYQRMPIERPAPPIMTRLPVTVPLQTGLKVIDAILPIGRGQRELILGDRQTGKTSLAIDAILNQKGKNVLCIYCAIGQRAASVAKTVAKLRNADAMSYTVVMATEGNDPPGLEYIAPYAATSIGEYFMQQGRDVLIVYDDLTQHARSYRELSLLLRRPPGREAFPGDIFYIHSRLLERATHLNQAHGGGSLTALPIIETEAQNMAAYIPTNLISITDGQIYLSPTLFALGVLPAVDVGKSVSRVGGKAQLKSFRGIVGKLKLAYAQFEELETFARFGARLDDNTQQIIERGKRIRMCLQQAESSPVDVNGQITILLSLTHGLLDAISLSCMETAQNSLISLANDFSEEIKSHIHADKIMGEQVQKQILQLAKRALHDILDSEAQSISSPRKIAKQNSVQAL